MGAVVVPIRDVRLGGGGLFYPPEVCHSNLLEEVFQPTFLTEIGDSESDRKSQNDLWRTTERCYSHTEVNPCEDVTAQETTNMEIRKETSEENSVEKRKKFRSNVDYRKTLAHEDSFDA